MLDKKKPRIRYHAAIGMYCCSGGDRAFPAFGVTPEKAYLSWASQIWRVAKGSNHVRA